MSLTLHPLARTTPRVRAELKAASASISDAVLATQYGLSLDKVSHPTPENLPIAA